MTDEIRELGAARGLPTRQERAKRAIDLSAAGVGLVVLSPLLLLSAVVVRATLGRPVFFRQVRAGRGGEPFTIVKLRTMDMAGARCCETPLSCIGLQLAPAARTPRVVGLLRRSGLDELPQLVNVLYGEMSFVGPRPLMVRYVERYTPTQARRLAVRPGITGWAQIGGRTDLPWPQRLDLDVWYVENWSLRLDARIVARTLLTALTGSGYSQEASFSGYEFLGTGAVPGTCPATGLPLTDPHADQPRAAQPHAAQPPAAQPRGDSAGSDPSAPAR